MVNLLTANVFYFSQLKTAGNAIASTINEHAEDILSPQTPSIAALVKFREDAIKEMRAANPGDAKYRGRRIRLVDGANFVGPRTNHIALSNV